MENLDHEMKLRKLMIIQVFPMQLDNKSNDILVENRYTREINLNFSSDNLRHFSHAIYSRRLSTDEISGQKLLVYCEYIDIILF